MRSVAKIGKNRPRALYVDVVQYAKHRALELYPNCRIVWQDHVIWVDEVHGSGKNDFSIKAGIRIERS
jgi:hypothetical protein